MSDTQATFLLIAFLSFVMCLANVYQGHKRQSWGTLALAFAWLLLGGWSMVRGWSA